MATSVSGSTAISGLSGSGTDFTTVLAQLRQVESIQINRLQAWKSDWKLRYDAFGQIIDQIQAASNMLTALSDRNRFVTKNVTSSNQNVVTAIANSQAQDVQHTINVKQVASNAIWANTGHTFNSKTDVVTTTGGDFKYTYAGKDHTVHVPKNTTLESFMYMVNNATDNPGVQVSLIQTGSGYVFQIAGKDTGAANDLYVHNSPGLLGMDATGVNSTWRTNNPVNPTAGITNPTAYTYEMVLENGSKRTFTIKGDATREDLEAAISSQLVGSGGSAAIDPGTGNLVLDGVKSVTRKSGGGTAAPQGALTSADTGLTLGSANLNDTLNDGDAYTLTRVDGSTVTYTYDAVSNNFDINDSIGGTTSVTAGSSPATKEDLLVAMGASASGGGDITLTLTNVQGFAQTSGSGGMAGISTSVTNAVTTVVAADFPGGRLETAPALNYTVKLNDGTTTTMTLSSGSSINDVITQLGAGGVSASLVKADGTSWTSPADGDAFLQIDNVLSASGPGVQGQVTGSDLWQIQRAANAVYQVDNWPMDMESAANKVSDVIEGVVFDIQDIGSARITVSTDLPSVEESIQNFLDAVNSVLITIRELTAYKDDKDVTSNDPNDIGKSNYSPSQLTSEKGALLQGNYGVQLLNSRFKNLLIGAPPGFKSKQSATDILSGDLVATLSSMGIKTCMDQKDPNYGLLQIAPNSSIAELKSMDMEHYQDMINNNLQGVVDFFCTSGAGSSTSADFRYGSHIEGLTKAGLYDVKYNVDANGDITSVTVGGVEARRDTSMPGYYYSVDKGPAGGLAIVIDNLAPGDHTGQVRIKEGLVQTVNKFLKDEMRFVDVNVGTDNPDAVALKSENGALMVLRDNYKKIMENIDTKIAREEHRLGMWEERQKRTFANLETMLKQYDEQRKRLESQLSQLSGSS